MKKVSAAVAAKEDDLERRLTANEEFHAKELEAQKLQHENNVHQALKAKEEFHDKKLEEYGKKMELLVNEFIKNEKARQIEISLLEEALREEKEEKCKHKATTEIKVDSFKELPYFVEEDVILDVSPILISEHQAQRVKTTQVSCFPNLDDQGVVQDELDTSFLPLLQENISITEKDKENLGEDQFWDDLEKFCSELDEKPSSTRTVVYEQIDKITDQILFQPEIVIINQQQDVIAVGHHPEIINHEQPISKQISKFVCSRGFPIRHLADIKSSEGGVGAHTPNINFLSDDVVVGVWIIADSSNNDDIFDQLGQVSTSLIKLKVFQKMINILSLFHLVMIINRHVFHQRLTRKGSYFSQSVNGFV